MGKNSDPMTVTQTQCLVQASQSQSHYLLRFCWPKSTLKNTFSPEANRAQTGGWFQSFSSSKRFIFIDSSIHDKKIVDHRFFSSHSYGSSNAWSFAGSLRGHLASIEYTIDQRNLLFYLIKQHSSQWSYLHDTIIGLKNRPWIGVPRHRHCHHHCQRHRRCRQLAA